MTRLPARAVVAGLLLALFAGGRTQAQTVEEWRKAAEETPASTAPIALEQSYHGVVPGAGNTLPRVAEIKGKPGTWVTWPGFLMLPDGGSRVFVQTTGPVTFERRDVKKAIVLRFKDAKVHLSNNRNPLVTLHFNTPMGRAYIKQRARVLELVMEMKVDQVPAISQVQDPDGYSYLFVDFPAGAYPIVAEPAGRPSFSGFGTPQSPAAPAKPASTTAAAAESADDQSGQTH